MKTIEDLNQAKNNLTKALPNWSFEIYGGSSLACFPIKMGVQAWDELSKYAFISSVCGCFYVVTTLKA